MNISPKTDALLNIDSGHIICYLVLAMVLKRQNITLFFIFAHNQYANIRALNSK